MSRAGGKPGREKPAARRTSSGKCSAAGHLRRDYGNAASILGPIPAHEPDRARSVRSGGHIGRRRARVKPAEGKEPPLQSLPGGVFSFSDQLFIVFRYLSIDDKAAAVYRLSASTVLENDKCPAPLRISPPSCLPSC